MSSIPALNGFSSVSFVVPAVVIGVILATSRLYVKRRVTNISIAKWSLKIALLFLFSFAWLALVYLGKPELVKGHVFLNRIHRYVVDYLEVYNLFSFLVAVIVAYLMANILYSIIRSFLT